MLNKLFQSLTERLSAVNVQLDDLKSLLAKKDESLLKLQNELLLRVSDIKELLHKVCS